MHAKMSLIQWLVACCVVIAFYLAIYATNDDNSRLDIQGKFQLQQVTEQGQGHTQGSDNIKTRTGRPNEENVIKSIQNEAPSSNKLTFTSNSSALYHHYGNRVDLRIIVLASTNWQSLMKTLNSLQNIVTDGRRVSLEIWVDRDHSGEVDNLSLKVATEFRWTDGPANVWVHGRHVGLRGQWLYTWRPRVVDGQIDGNELALFIENGVDVSRYAYKWLRAVYQIYQSRDDIACYGIQDENAIVSRGKKSGHILVKPSDVPLYLYRLVPTWAMAPEPVTWHKFQDWYENIKTDLTFHPYVMAAPFHLRWYKLLEKQKRHSIYWSMWFVYYMFQHNLFCTYANLPTFTARRNTSFSVNRQEPGTYVAPVRTYARIPILLSTWEDEFSVLPNKLPKYDFDGSVNK